MATEAEASTEDVVAKYKRLLSLARSSLEANQATLAAKDRHISQLLTALEEEKAHRQRRPTTGKDDDSQTLRRILRRVDVDDVVWILVEHEASDDSWLSFGNEQELEDFVQRLPGPPLKIPPRCLSPTESAKIEEESKRRVERIVEEFRRYKVRSEIERKTKEAEARQTTLRSAQMLSSSSFVGASGSNTSIPTLMDKAMAEDSVGSGKDRDSAKSDEIDRIRAQLGDQEAKWRAAYEKVVKENELLRARGGEALLATQWRERYEACQKEKDDIAERLKLFTKSSESTGGGSGGTSIEQAYIELKEEYKELRRRVQVEKARRQTSGGSDGRHNRVDANSGGDMSPRQDSSEYGSRSGSYQLGSTTSDGVMSGHGLRSMGMGESKIQYIRHMVLQYLSCKDSIVRPHIESALVAIFRFNEAERTMIEQRKKEESMDTLSSITSFLGSLTAATN